MVTFSFCHCYYRISSYKTQGYYFFTRPSSAGIIRMRVLIKGWYYYTKTPKPWSLYYQNRAVFAWRHRTKWGKSINLIIRLILIHNSLKKDYEIDCSLWHHHESFLAWLNWNYGYQTTTVLLQQKTISALFWRNCLTLVLRIFITIIPAGQ